MFVYFMTTITINMFEIKSYKNAVCVTTRVQDRRYESVPVIAYIHTYYYNMLLVMCDVCDACV